MKRQMMRVISSPSSSTTGLATLILGMKLLGRWRGAGGAAGVRRGPNIASTPRRASGGGPQGLDQGGGVRHRRQWLAADAVEHLVDLGDHGEKPPAGGGREALLDDVVDQLEQRLPEAVDVDQDDRLVVQPQLPPGQHLEGLVERAEAAGEDREGVGAIE